MTVVTTSRSLLNIARPENDYEIDKSAVNRKEKIDSTEVIEYAVIQITSGRDMTKGNVDVQTPAADDYANVLNAGVADAAPANALATSVQTPDQPVYAKVTQLNTADSLAVNQSDSQKAVSDNGVLTDNTIIENKCCAPGSEPVTSNTIIENALYTAN